MILFSDSTFLLLLLFRHAYKARSYYIFMAYLFGEPIASRWPDFKKLTAKITEVNPAHFISSYCHQVIILCLLKPLKANICEGCQTKNVTSRFYKIFCSHSNLLSGEGGLHGSIIYIEFMVLSEKGQ